ncbi:hypothetical protein V1478_006554 [Vespula squamosa]|uniref:Uncharacterized protein n=1 Tax=Vespula squamosa TaxID=30214 RepID=A0ABD2B859_VESSQ
MLIAHVDRISNIQQRRIKRRRRRSDRKRTRRKEEEDEEEDEEDEDKDEGSSKTSNTKRFDMVERIVLLSFFATVQACDPFTDAREIDRSFSFRHGWWWSVVLVVVLIVKHCRWGYQIRTNKLTYSYFKAQQRLLRPNERTWLGYFKDKDKDISTLLTLSEQQLLMDLR